MSSNPLTTENRTDTENDITGPHADFDHHGTHDHYFWRCENCGPRIHRREPAYRVLPLWGG